MYNNDFSDFMKIDNGVMGFDDDGDIEITCDDFDSCTECPKFTNDGVCANGWPTGL